MENITRLLSRFMWNFIFFQPEPNTNESGEFHTRQGQSWSRFSCRIHTASQWTPNHVQHPRKQEASGRYSLICQVVYYTIELGSGRITSSGLTASDTLVETAWGNMPTTLIRPLHQHRWTSRNLIIRHSCQERPTRPRGIRMPRPRVQDDYTSWSWRVHHAVTCKRRMLPLFLWWQDGCGRTGPALREETQEVEEAQ